MRRVDSWTESRICDLIARGSTTNVQIARNFGLSVGTVQCIAKRNGLTRQYSRWTDEEVEFLVSSYADIGPQGVARALGRHPNTQEVSRKARTLGLSAEHLRRRGGRWHGEPTKGHRDTTGD